MRYESSRFSRPKRTFLKSDVDANRRRRGVATRARGIERDDALEMHRAAIALTFAAPSPLARRRTIDATPADAPAAAQRHIAQTKRRGDDARGRAESLAASERRDAMTDELVVYALDEFGGTRRRERRRRGTREGTTRGTLDGLSARTRRASEEKATRVMTWRVGAEAHAQTATLGLLTTPRTRAGTRRSNANLRALFD